jgi:signal transduction histidine kinase
MKDMHDGLGGALVSALVLVERGTCSADKIAGSLRYALDDMKIIIDSLDPAVQEITTALGTLRERLEHRLSQRGMKFDWKVQRIPSALRLGPSEVLDILRITQECVTNVLKYAEATTVEVMTGTRRGAAGKPGAFVRITDNGLGFNVERIALGRGLGNMHARAKRLHGELSVTSKPRKGTSVELWLPFEQQQS